VPVGSYHDLLEVERGATDEEVRRAYKRAKEVYAADSLARYGLFDEAGLVAVRAQLDEAFDVLLDPARRRPYELSVFPPDPEPEPRQSIADDGEPKPPAPIITPDSEFTGELLRAVRESQGVDLRDVSHSTKIGIGYLRAIEAEQFDALPAAVYVRGFVAELAKSLRLDPEQVSRSYLRRFRRHAEPREGL
jgi:flagellar biosynthesis protein FlhG